MKEEELKEKLKVDGHYLLKYDDEIWTDFWSPNEEVIHVVNGQMIDFLGIKFSTPANLLKSLQRVEQIKPEPKGYGVCSSIRNDCYKVIDI